tara:strand:- start:1386 stop:1649 length:264 start_codon:yes stop_codon:yes gene_type:complete
MSSRLLEGIIEYYEEEEILMANGFDEAVIGIDDKTMRLIYSVTKCIEILMVEMEMDIEEAVEFFEFNVKGSELGDKTPIWCEDMLIQ